jgi:hypothetical protein
VTSTTETFTGTNGSAPASPRVVDVLGTNTGGYGRIESNTLETNQPNIAYHGVVCNWDGNNYADLDTKVKITTNATDSESYPAIGFRMAGGTMGWFEPWGEVNNGYCAYLSNTGHTLNLQKVTGGSQVTSWQSTGHVITGGSSWWIRVRAVGTLLKVKAWNDSGAEPTTGGPDGDGFTIKQTDALYTTGRVGIRGQAQTANIKTRFDDWTLDDLVSGPTPHLLAGQFDVLTGLDGALRATKLLDGQFDVPTTFTGVLRVPKLLAGQIDVAVGTTGALHVVKALAGQFDISTSTAGALKIPRLLAGQIDLQVGLSGAMSLPMLLAGQFDIATSVAGNLPIPKRLSGQVDITTDVAGMLRVAKLLYGRVDVVTDLTGIIDLLGTGIAGDLTISISLTGNLQVGTSEGVLIEFDQWGPIYPWLDELRI